MIKSITCRVHNTEWQLIRLDKHDFINVSRLGITGHPAYYRAVSQDEEPETEGRIRQSEIEARARGYEVWPHPVPGVEIIPVYEEAFDAS